MTRGIAVRDLDVAGGRQLAPATPWFRVEGHPVVTKGDPVEGHGDGAHASPVMAEGEDRFRISGRPASRKAHQASCAHVTSGRPWFRLGREPAERAYLGPSDEDVCTVEHIPHIMRNRGWHTGARLMDQWFENPAGTDREAVPVDDTTVTLDWILSFDRARGIYDQAIADRIWANDAAKRVIAEWLQANGKFRDWPTRFGNFQKPIRELHKDHIQSRVSGYGLIYVDSYFWDDLLAALARFTFHFVVAGRVTPVGTSHLVSVDEVGIYVRDSYDFQGDQSLGAWKLPNWAEVFEFPGSCPTCNATFRDWRAAHGRGGDYFVFSDIRILATNDQFMVGQVPALSIGLPSP